MLYNTKRLCTALFQFFTYFNKNEGGGSKFKMHLFMQIYVLVSVFLVL